MGSYKAEITGHLDIVVTNNEDDFEGQITKWQEVLIHGDPEGLVSFARLLMRLAELKQDESVDLPPGARAHIHLRPNIDLSTSSIEVIVGRLDAKGSGDFYNSYISKDH